MKKSILLILALVICLSVLLVSCGEATEAGDTSQNNTESSLPPSSETNDSSQTTSNWYDNAVSLTPSAPETPSQPDEPSHPDEPSMPDEPSQPDNPSQPGESVYELDGYTFVRDAKSYHVDFTKVSPVAAQSCVTNTLIGVTAIYDGAITRFFGAVDGTFYCSVYGNYNRTLGEVFLWGECDDNLTAIKLNFDETGAYVDYNKYTESIPPHDEMQLYSAYDKKAYLYRPCCDSGVWEYKSGTSAICRYYESASSFEDEWNANLYVDIDETKLGKWGVVRDGQIIIPFEYDSIYCEQTSEEVGVYSAQKDGKTYYISSDGTVLNPEGFTCGSQPFNNRAWIFDGEYGFIIKFN